MRWAIGTQSAFLRVECPLDPLPRLQTGEAQFLAERLQPCLEDGESHFAHHLGLDGERPRLSRFLAGSSNLDEAIDAESEMSEFRDEVVGEG